jgi:Trk K+ transport system NAD-binding subunit
MFVPWRAFSLLQVMCEMALHTMGAEAVHAKVRDLYHEPGATAILPRILFFPERAADENRNQLCVKNLTASSV